MNSENTLKGQHQQQQKPEQQQDISGGFSKSGHYDLLRDVILRAEVMSDNQTKVLPVWSYNDIH